MSKNRSSIHLPVDVCKSLFFSKAHSVELCFLHVISMHYHVGSVRLTLLDLHNRSYVGHDDRRWYVQNIGVVAEPLRMVTEGGGNNATGLRLLG